MKAVARSPRESHPWILLPILVCAVGAVLALSGRPVGFTMAALAAGAYLWFALISLRQPLILAAGLLLVIEVLPPFYLSALGDTPIYASFFALPIVAAVLLMRAPDIHWKWDPISKGLAAFL